MPPKNGGGKPGPGHKYLRELIKKDPERPALTIAKIAYGKHPELWKDLERCRTAVRVLLGIAGKKMQSFVDDKSLFRKPRPAGFRGIIPKASKRFKWSPFIISGAQRVLILSDLQMPFHDEVAINAALEWGKKRSPSIILLNGDIADHYYMSNFDRDPREPKRLKHEVMMVRKFLKGLRERFKQARIIYKHGNHEERYERYLINKAPELLDINHFKWDRLFGLKKWNVELVEDKRPIRFGNNLHVIHGHEYKFNISNPVSPARGIFLRAKVHCIAGHFHQSTQFSDKNLEQKVITTWSTGCLCNLHPQWLPINNWNHGFAWAEIDERGAFHVENLRIIDGRVY